MVNLYNFYLGKSLFSFMRLFWNQTKKRGLADRISCSSIRRTAERS